MKTNNTNIPSTILITGAITALTVMSNIVLSSSTRQSKDANTSATTAAESPSSSFTDQVIMHLDSAISAIKSGDNDEGRKQLLQAEKLLEGVESAVDSEKRIEAALKILKDGDSNGSISQADEAKKLLTA
jgi:H2-forming N5,N10-methylenetetrahydromethanopterin dehydrogenase-like enzyme